MYILEGDYLTKDMGTPSISKRLISQETLFVPEEVMRNIDEGRNTIKYRGLRGAGQVKKKVSSNASKWKKKKKSLCEGTHLTYIEHKNAFGVLTVCLDNHVLLYLVIHYISFFRLSLLMFLNNDFSHLYFSTKLVFNY